MNPTHRERIHAALRGNPTDRVPVALWRHFPNDDLDAEKFAARVVEFQNKFDFDLVKVTPAAGFPAEMYGAVLKDAQNREGTRAYVSRPVNTIGDWAKIAPLDETNPVFKRELDALKLIRAKLGKEIHILQTVFAPLNTAHNLAGERLFADLLAQPRTLHRALEAIAETTKRFALASLRAGADAIFYATQMGTFKYFSADEFHEFGVGYDLDLLGTIRAAQPDFILLHAHGVNLHFDEFVKYPVEVLNWHDRRTEPSLKNARAKFGGALLGGLHELETLLGNSREAIIAQAKDAIAQTNVRGFILGAGCVIQTDMPDENIRAVIEATKT